MKRLYILILLLALTLVGCAGNTTSTDEDVDLTALPYYSYLSDTNPVVTITVKDVGVLKLQLFPDVAGNTVNNFIHYIQNKSYSNSTFHRVIEDFMIQGGIVSDTGCAIRGEFSSNGVSNDLSHYRGVISMARTTVKNSATSQFFIVHIDSDKNRISLDGNYAAFGGLISGFDILDDIAGVLTGLYDAPIQDVVIKSITIDLNGYTVDYVVCVN